LQDSEENTSLHIAIQNQHAEIISLLLGHPSIDLSLRNRVGLTPFATALTVRNHKAAQAILDKMPTAAEQVKQLIVFCPLKPCRLKRLVHIAVSNAISLWQLSTYLTLLGYKIPYRTVLSTGDLRVS